MYVFSDYIDAGHGRIMLAKPLSQCNGRPVGSVAIHHTGRDHLQALIGKAPFFQKLRAHAGRGAEIMPMEKPRKRSGLMSRLAYRLSVLACFLFLLLRSQPWF